MTNIKPPPTNFLTEREKERLANKFLEGAPRISKERTTSSEKKEVIFLRIPSTVNNDLQRICNLTGYKKNMFCLQAIIEAVNDKLKQIEREI